VNFLADLSPGFFDDDLLGEQMRLVSAYLDSKSIGKVKPPSSLPLYWHGYEDALAVRTNELMAEMQLRKIPTPDWIRLTDEAIVWPVLPEKSLMEQYAFLVERADKGKTGRIRLPRSPHELWASYKYSTLARNHKAYLQFGQRIATRTIDFPLLLPQLTSICRVKPALGCLRNSLQHMWGYVSKYSTLDPNKASLAELLAEVQLQAVEHADAYLLNSTSLSELAAWLPSLPEARM
jgi:hypothetical protein